MVFSMSLSPYYPQASQQPAEDWGRARKEACPQPPARPERFIVRRLCHSSGGGVRGGRRRCGCQGGRLRQAAEPPRQRRAIVIGRNGAAPSQCDVSTEFPSVELAWRLEIHCVPTPWYGFLPWWKKSKNRVVLPSLKPEKKCLLFAGGQCSAPTNVPSSRPSTTGFQCLHPSPVPSFRTQTRWVAHRCRRGTDSL